VRAQPGHVAHQCDALISRHVAPASGYFARPSSVSSARYGAPGRRNQRRGPGDAFNSAWLGISGVSYTSLNGYTYPGYAAAIPEPTSAALLLAGLALVALAAKRGR
jgi:hypothetical protein